MAATKKSALDVLKANAAPASDKKASKTPTVHAPPALVDDILAWAEANKMAEEAKAKMEAAKGGFYDEVQEMRFEWCQRQGKVEPSINVIAESKDGAATIMLTQAARWSNMQEATAKPILEAEFGDDYDKFFKDKIEGSFKADDFTKEELEKMVAALGPEGVKKITINSVVVPTEAFLTAATLDPVVHAKWKNIRTKHGLCNIAAASIKPK